MRTMRAWIGAGALAILSTRGFVVLAQAPVPPAAQSAASESDSLPSSIPMPAIPLPDAGAPFADYSHAWPKRLPMGKDGSLTLAIEQPGLAWDFRQLSFDPRFPNQEDDSDAKAALIAAGIVFDEAKVRQAIEFEDFGSFIVRIGAGTRRGSVKRTPGAEQFLIETLCPAANASGTPKLERTWFAFYTPKTPKNTDAANTPAPRGIALLMPGVFGTPEGTLESTVASLRSHGWHVLRMLAQPSRFTQRITFSVDPEVNDEMMDAKGAEIAVVLSDRAAECAYAVQGAFQHILAEHTELARLPRIAIGFSGGAISLPVVVAREPDAYAATVLVGGGAHYWLMNAHSSYADMIAAITIKWTTPPTIEQRRRIAEAYLRHAPLDSFHTAAALRGKPTLFIQANADSAVAAVLGDVLWERAGKPDRWIRPGEHLPLFISLLKDLPAINDWLDHHVDVAKAAAGDAKIPAMPSSVPNPVPKEPK